MIAITLSGCSNALLTDVISEGIIEYSVSFPDYAEDGLMSSMLPNRTTLKFKEGKEVTELVAGMGVFKTRIMADANENLVNYHLTILGKKLVSEISPEEIDDVMTQKGTKNYIFTNEMDTIAGFPCKKAIVVFDEIDTKEIEIYYTDRIKMKNANWYNPFKEIPGVMLRYEFDQYDMRMRLEASSVLAREVTDNEFHTLPDFEQVEPIRLQHELEEVLSTFSL